MTRVAVFVRILDVNDNAPQFAVFYDTFVCENARPGQVSTHRILKCRKILTGTLSIFFSQS